MYKCLLYVSYFTPHTPFVKSTSMITFVFISNIHDHIRWISNIYIYIYICLCVAYTHYFSVIGSPLAKTLERHKALFIGAFVQPSTEYTPAPDAKT